MANTFNVLDTPATTSGVYTPTTSVPTNLDSLSVTQAQYMRVGSVVTVSGSFSADPTITATDTSFEMSLPVASNIGVAEDAAGVATNSFEVSAAGVNGIPANNTVTIRWMSVGTFFPVPWSYTFTYRVI